MFQTDRADRKQLAAVLKSDPAAPLRLAKLDGKYRMLMRQIRVTEPGDDLIIERGSRTVTTYRGHKDLPSGYWVYVRPYWFIWRHSSAEKLRKRSWGPEQITGKPDGSPGQDADTAWATKLENNKVTEFAT